MIGATGDVGRQVCTQLVERQVLPPTSRLQLVGRRGGASSRAVHGLRADLVDAYDEHAPISLPAGNYRVVQQRRFAPLGQWRRAPD